MAEILSITSNINLHLDSTQWLISTTIHNSGKIPIKAARINIALRSSGIFKCDSRMVQTQA